jgi:hypothetical protein
MIRVERMAAWATQLGIESAYRSAQPSHPQSATQQVQLWLQVDPPSLVLVAGGLSELHLQFCPLTTGRLDVRVNLVDADTRELVNALLVAADAQIPLVTRSFEVMPGITHPEHCCPLSQSGISQMGDVAAPIDEGASPHNIWGSAETASPW